MTAHVGTAIRVGTGEGVPALGDGVLGLVVDDVKGRYALPYIQADLALRVQRPACAPECAVSLCRGGQPLATAQLAGPTQETVLACPGPGTYAVRVEAPGAAPPAVAVGVGTVVAALGDSITEGYFGAGFRRPLSLLTAAEFPPEAVSRDRRNFPQYAPTSQTHLPEINCFASWLGGLNDQLAAAWGHPVFIANEGWGGITATGYLEMARTDRGWQQRLRRLAPTLWLIHLGVNDGRQGRAAAAVREDLEALVTLLCSDYGAAPERILLARPSYDYHEGAAARLARTAAAIDALCAQRGVTPGPDFFTAYAVDRERWYGADPVHPNPQGMARMADLWAEAIRHAYPTEGPVRRKDDPHDGT